MDWLGWAIPTAFGLATGVAAYFIKRSINKKDRERTAKDAKWEKDQQDLKDEILCELQRYHKETAGRLQKLEIGYEKLDNKLRETLENLPKEYTSREDWLRFSSKIDMKLDGIQNLIIDLFKGGKGKNENA